VANPNLELKVCLYSWGTYFMHMNFLYIYRAHELTKFTIFFEKVHTCFSIQLYMCIKFQVPISNNE
jgi:hypothetical protein